MTIERKYRPFVLFLGAIIVAFCAYILLPTSSDDTDELAADTRPADGLVAVQEASSPIPSEHHEALKPQPDLLTDYEVKPGDTLSAIFSNRGFDYVTLTAVLSADEELLALDVLRPGDSLRFEQSRDSGELTLLSLIVHPGHTIQGELTLQSAPRSPSYRPDRAPPRNRLRDADWHTSAVGR